MYDADHPTAGIDADQLLLDFKLAGVEPVAPQRACGDVFESPVVGRLEFAPMPHGRPSFWHGEQRMPDSRFTLKVVCEVEGDRRPGADQMACVVAFRRLQVQDAMLCAPLINARLQQLRPSRFVTADDLVLTSIHLAPHPLTDARFELGFRARSKPQMQFTVVFVQGAPRSVRIDSDA
jgi:hypothetical protein